MPESVGEIAPTEAERIAFGDRLASGGNAWAALVRAVEDALADLAEAERRSPRRDRLISHGYVRARLGGTGHEMERLCGLRGRCPIIAGGPCHRRGVYDLDRLRQRFGQHA